MWCARQVLRRVGGSPGKPKGMPGIDQRALRIAPPFVLEAESARDLAVCSLDKAFGELVEMEQRRLSQLYLFALYVFGIGQHDPTFLVHGLEPTMHDQLADVSWSSYCLRCACGLI